MEAAKPMTIELHGGNDVQTYIEPHESHNKPQCLEFKLFELICPHNSKFNSLQMSRAPFFVYLSDELFADIFPYENIKQRVTQHIQAV